MTTSKVEAPPSVRESLLRARVVAAVLFAAAVFSVSMRVETARFGTGFETMAVAQSIVDHGVFGDPYSSLKTGPTAHVAPVYPAFLAFWLWIFGQTQTFRLVAMFCSMAVHGLHAAVLPSVSEIFFGDRRPGIAAALITIVLPVYFLFPQFEVIYFATALMMFCVLSYRLAERGGVWSGIGTGAACGFVALLNPASLTVMGPWLLYVYWRCGKARRAAFVVCCGLGVVAMLAPWTVRNYRQFHSWFLIRDNLGLELYVSNTDHAGSTLEQNRAAGLYARRHPDQNPEEAAEVLRVGEIAYNRERMAETRTWIRGHFGEFLGLSAARARNFWFPIAEGYPLYAFAIAFVTIVSIPGFVLLAIGRKPIVLFLAAVELFYPILYYMVQNDPRFRAPILWVSLLGTGYALTYAWSSVRAAIQPVVQRLAAAHA